MIPKDFINNFLLQKKPFVFVDDITKKWNKMYSVLTVYKNMLFIEQEQLMESGVIEHQAQSIAILNLWKEYESLKDLSLLKPKNGYLTQVKNFKLYRYPKLSETIYSQIQLDYNFDNDFIYKCQSFIADEMVASTELNIKLFKENE